MAAFDARRNALEGSWFRTEERLATERHVERLVKQGRLPDSVLLKLRSGVVGSAAAASGQLPAFYGGVPLTVRNTKPTSEHVYQHQKGLFPAPTPSTGERYALGSRVSLGRARWTIDDASIFSVQDGKRLAQTPVKENATAWESARARKIQLAAQDTPLVNGYRLLPELTPGRALLWGSILALWGTAAAVSATCKSLGIHKVEDAAPVFREMLAPVVGSFAVRMEALKPMFSLAAVAHNTDFAQSQLAKGLKVRLQGSQ